VEELQESSEIFRNWERELVAPVGVICGLLAFCLHTFVRFQPFQQTLFDHLNAIKSWFRP